jgi:hypothetical protein
VQAAPAAAQVGLAAQVVTPSASASEQVRPLQQSAATVQAAPAAAQVGLAAQVVTPSASASEQVRPLQQSAATVQAAPSAAQSTSKSTATVACPLRRMFNVTEAGAPVCT